MYFISLVTSLVTSGSVSSSSMMSFIVLTFQIVIMLNGGPFLFDVCLIFFTGGIHVDLIYWTYCIFLGGGCILLWVAIVFGVALSHV